MITGFIVVAWLIALVSWLFVSNATSGVAGLCFACFMVICARIAQADAHHAALLARLAPAVHPDVTRTTMPAATPLHAKVARA